MTSYKSQPDKRVANATTLKAGGVGAGTSPPPKIHDVRTQLYTNESLSCIATRRWSG
jgi:hypothetical protein